MTQEDKDLLLKDLCARLPYGVKFSLNENIYTAKGLDLIVTDDGVWDYAVTAKGIVPIEIDFVKPYLRPMSNMAEEEREEYDEWHLELESGKIKDWKNADYIDWLNKHHFDYRGLILKGLALEAKE